MTRFAFRGINASYRDEDKKDLFFQLEGKILHQDYRGLDFLTYNGEGFINPYSFVDTVIPRLTIETLKIIHKDILETQGKFEEDNGKPTLAEYFENLIRLKKINKTTTR